jgi:predicted transcriptional regulator
MPLVEFTYFDGTANLPIVATAMTNGKVVVGQIDTPDGQHFRAHCFLPGSRSTKHVGKDDAAKALEIAVFEWFSDAGFDPR